MYKIIGADQKEYGPVPAEQIRQWIAEGRVNAQTKVRVGDDWKSLADVPEFADALSRRFQAPPRQQAATYTAAPTAPAKTSAMAVTSLVLGILGLFTCGITALFGLVLGIISLVHIKGSAGRLAGSGIALAGTIISGVFLLLLPLLAAMFLPAFAMAKERAQTIVCMNNLRELASATRVYASQNNDRFPPAATWSDAIPKDMLTEHSFQCPRVSRTERCSYAFNERLGGMETSKVNPETVMFFEADAGWNSSGGRELATSRHRWRAQPTYVVALADGSVQRVDAAQLGSLRWEP